MNATTLDDLVNGTYTVDAVEKDLVTKSKEQAREALPFERVQFENIIQENKIDYMEGYDNRFKRIDWNVIENSTKIVNGNIVPAFAYYNVNKQSNVCERNFNINSMEDYEKVAEVNKKLVKHSKFRLNLQNHVYHNYDDNKSALFFVPSMILGGLSIIPLVSHSPLWGFATAALLTTFSWGVYCLNNHRQTLTFNSTYTHSFNGVLPNEIRNIVKNERGGFDSIFLVEEAYDWKIKHSEEEIVTKVPRNVDPILVGFKNERAFVLAKFDVSPLEQHLLSEFSA